MIAHLSSSPCSLTHQGHAPACQLSPFIKQQPCLLLPGCKHLLLPWLILYEWSKCLNLFQCWANQCFETKQGFLQIQPGLNFSDRGLFEQWFHMFAGQVYGSGPTHIMVIFFPRIHTQLILIRPWIQTYTGISPGPFSPSDFQSGAWGCFGTVCTAWLHLPFYGNKEIAEGNRFRL